MSRGKFPGIAGCVQLVALLRDKPASICAFRAEHGLSYCGAYGVIGSLYALGMAHVSGWVVRPRCRPVAVFSFGPGVDVECPDRTSKGRQSKGGEKPGAKSPSTTMVALVYAMRAIQDQPHSREELSEITGLHRRPCVLMLKAMVDLGFAHVAGWERAHIGAPIPTYGAGMKPPAKRPKREARKAINARYWQRYRERQQFAALHQAFTTTAPQEATA